MSFGRRADAASSGVSEKLLQQARSSGQLNLSSRQLLSVPPEVWRINDVASQGKPVEISFDAKGPGWWDQNELQKLILASNAITDIPDDVASLPALAVLDVHDNKLVSVSPAIGQLQSLHTLSLSHNQLRLLPDAVCHLGNLKTLRVDHNQLQALPPNLELLAGLEQLHASHNELAAVPEGVGALARLQQLTLNNNQLRSLPRSIGRLTMLREFEVTYNRLETLPAEIQSLHQITRLDLRHNQLTQPPLLASAAGLREVCLGFNRLTTLGDCESFPASVNILDLRDNKLKELPAGIARLAQLERLDVANNDLTKLPPQLGTLRGMKSLVLEGNSMRSIRRDIIARGTPGIMEHLRNQLSTAPEEEAFQKEAARAEVSRVSEDIRQSKTLEYSKRGVDLIPASVWEAAEGQPITRLVLSRNRLVDLPAQTDMFAATLTTLDLSYNKMARLSAAVLLLKHLKTLNLQGNLLSSLPDELCVMDELTDLVLSYNRFTSLPSAIYALPSVETVVASDCQIAELDAKSLRLMDRLGCLDVSNNQIRQVPPEIGLISTLKSLKLEGNMFKIPRPAVLQKGTPAVMEYLRGRVVQ